ncbi:hypothetical protein BGX33_002845 [Mortierella sp. NVP41]|nr:hypothetical protein BGX33_002845 [Mortierella sp. NVP41]
MQFRYHFHGMKLDEDQFTPEWTTVTKDDNYQFFDPGNRWNWNRLVIESIPLDELDRCTVCLYRLKEDDALGCGHRLHKECASKFVDFCPSCKFNPHPHQK